MTVFEAISLIFAVTAIVISVFAYKPAKRAAEASEDSARHAGKANDLNLIQFFQNNMTSLLAEIEKQKALGNETTVKALQFSFKFTVLEMFKKMAKESDREGRRKFANFFRGIAKIDPNAKPEAFLAEIFGDDYEPPLE